jgi:crossover junction endodeoxyribonuclease RuvC
VVFVKKIIGIDPGLAGTGIGIVVGSGLKIQSYSFGTLNTKKEYSLPVRLDSIYSRLLTVLENEKPDLMVVEDVFSLERYPKSGILLGKVTGVILLAGCKEGVTVREVPVREAKKILSGNGNADKKQLELSVRKYLNHTGQIKPSHASDALALAIIGLFRFNKWCG